MGCLLFLCGGTPQKQSQTVSPSAAGASSEKKCRLTIGCGSSALRWTTARAEFAPVCRESLGIGAALDAWRDGCRECCGIGAVLDAWRGGGVWETLGDCVGMCWRYF